MYSKFLKFDKNLDGGNLQFLQYYRKGSGRSLPFGPTPDLQDGYNNSQEEVVDVVRVDNETCYTREHPEFKILMKDQFQQFKKRD